VLARLYFGLTRRLPWRLMRFLADAVSRGLLVESGAMYSFHEPMLVSQLRDPDG
jgi:hypothetical protein